MKKITFLLSALLLINQAFTQDMEVNSAEESVRFIRADWEIPAHNLYQQDWSSEYVVGRELPLPFGSNNDLKIILVEETNAPFAMPCAAEKVLSGYGGRSGRMHTGIDLKLAARAPVSCCFDGVVRLVKHSPSYGKVVVVRHYNGLETLYGHLDSICVQKDEVVRAGKLIGLAGRTGRATTDHLHFEARFLYTHFNPAKMIDFGAEELISNILVLTREDLHAGEEFEEAAANATDKATSSPTGEFHVVKAGETLYRIAMQYGTSVERLCQLNRLDERTPLQVGQQLRVK